MTRRRHPMLTLTGGLTRESRNDQESIIVRLMTAALDVADHPDYDLDSLQGSHGLQNRV